MKALFLAFVLLASVPCYSQDFGSILYYPFNDNFLDFSGNQLHASGIDVEFAAGPGGEFGNSASFNGFSSEVVLPFDDELDLEPPFTFAFWMMMYEPNFSVISLEFIEDHHSGAWISLSHPDQRLAINVGNGWGCFSTHRRTKTTFLSPAHYQWYHIIGEVHDEDQLELYIDCEIQNGVYEGDIDEVSFSQAHSGVIGKGDASCDADPYYFHGRIDEFQLWDRLLFESEKEWLCPQIKDHTVPLQISFHSPESNEHDEDVLIFDSAGRLVFQGNRQAAIKWRETSKGGFYIEKTVLPSTTIKTHGFFIVQ